MSTTNQLKIKQLMEILPSLKSAELEELKNKVGFLLQSKESVSSTTEQELFYDCILTQLKRSTLGGTLPPSLSVLKRIGSLKKFREVHSGVEQYMLNLSGGKVLITRKVKLRFYTLASCLVVTYIVEKTSIPLSMKSVLSMFTDLPGILDRGFPGYVAGGLGHVVLRLGEDGLGVGPNLGD